MKLPFALSIIPVIIICTATSFAQKNIVKDIKSFGAKGDGRTNDQEAFQKAAAYFNARGGNGNLVISKGVYIVGRQTFTGGKPINKPAYEGEDVLHFRKIKNFTIRGSANAIIQYKDSLRFGAFSPETGKPYDHGNNFMIYSYAAFAGKCVFIDSCFNVSVTNLTINGNNKGLILGGVYGDVGRQLSHYGICIQNSKNIVVNTVNVHHFGLDGIWVANEASQTKDSIMILNSAFEYNSRQGFSWVGGNSLIVKNCKFDHTGKEAFASAPTAGVDIEAEVGPISNGHFTNCEFINNRGAGLVADNGNDSNCTFVNCTFWGTTNWSIWVTKPRFTFSGCDIYGSPVHGYNSPDEENATKFISCTFEDKPYEGKDPYGNFLIESNGARRVSFTNCKFIANKKRLCWVSIDPTVKPEEKYQFTNCSFLITNVSDSNRSLLGLMRGTVLKDCSFDFKNPQAKKKGLPFINRPGENVDLGGNSVIDSEKK